MDGHSVQKSCVQWRGDNQVTLLGGLSAGHPMYLTEDNTSLILVH